MSSMHHYSPETTLYWTSDHQQQQQQQQQEAATWLSNSHTPRFNLNEDDDEEDDVVVSDKATNNLAQEQEKEAMFEKPLTPSDVGKLNRLVIPKQHAEKYFPLDSSGGDSAAAKGLLLSFEDESGKCWRFRYSYWNSSQSYVLTKGWSRYVKDKRLHAGDVVLFHRHRAHPQRFFISCTRHQPNPNPPAHVSIRSSSFYSALPAYPTHHHHHLPFPYQPHSLHAPGGGSQGQNETTPGGNSSSGRVLRLFGVNMECQPDNDNDSQNSTHECSYTHLYHHQTSSYPSSNPHHHMLPQQP
ncbi:hypothetical protein AAZX31_19G183500 [Glycine max]|nr:hypothetical protein JHK86_053990 [Glycine max]KAG4928460.1 hypothetical protein JHK85_054946 [Glycine max]KAH1195416.1 B3 domain-containing protein [Glycine max]